MKPLQTYFPFGPPIGHAVLPEEMIKDLNKGCDDIVKDEEFSKSEDWSPNLVGQVEQEIKIPLDILNKWARWFSTQIQTYVAGYFNQLYIPQQTILGASREKSLQTIGGMKINVLSAWYVRSFAGDYNPVHTHTDCQLTCVGYLKVPDFSKERQKGGANLNMKSYAPGGNLEVLSSIGVIPSNFEVDYVEIVYPNAIHISLDEYKEKIVNVISSIHFDPARGYTLVGQTVIKPKKIKISR